MTTSTSFYEVNFRDGNHGEESEVVEASTFITEGTTTTFRSDGDAVLVILTESIVSIRKLHVPLDQAARIVFAPAGNEGEPPTFEFVETETDDGRGIGLGHWVQHAEGLSALRFTVRDLVEQLAKGPRGDNSAS